MSSAVLVARLLLSGVFALAAVMKLVDLAASRAAVEGFGVPRRLARALGTALPFGELAVAAALLPSPSARWGAVGALVLLATFSAGVGQALRAGRAVDCNCFGQVSSAPISARTLVRNGVLSLVAIFALIWAPGSALTSWTSNGAASNLVAALAVTVAAVLAVVIWTRRGVGGAAAGQPAAVPAALAPTLPVGSPAPDFELPDLSGAATSLKRLLEHGRPVVLIFASPMCPPCRQLLPQLARWNQSIGDDVTLVVVESTVPDGQLPDDQRALLDGLVALTEPRRELAADYGAPGTPCAIAIAADGRVASAPMAGAGHVERLVRRVLADGGAVPGEPAPSEPVVRA